MKKSILLAAAALFAATAYAAPTGDEIKFTPAETDITTAPGETFQLKFNLTNTVRCHVVEFWIENTDGKFEVAFDKEEGEYMVNFGERLMYDGKPSKYNITADYNVENHDFWILGECRTEARFMPTGEGLFCTVTMITNDDLEPGDYKINIIKGNFCWFNAEDEQENIETPDFSFNVKVADSGLSNVNADAFDASKEVYDLMGRPVSNPAAGIYIQNGQKVLVK